MAAALTSRVTTGDEEASTDAVAATSMRRPWCWRRWAILAVLAAIVAGGLCGREDLRQLIHERGACEHLVDARGACGVDRVRVHVRDVSEVRIVRSSGSAFSAAMASRGRTGRCSGRRSPATAVSREWCRAASGRALEIDVGLSDFAAVEILTENMRSSMAQTIMECQAQGSGAQASGKPMILEVRAVRAFLQERVRPGVRAHARGGAHRSRVTRSTSCSRPCGTSTSTSRHILLTHAHVDHITGVAAAKDALDVPVYLHRDDLFLYERAVQQGAMFGFKVRQPPPVDLFYDAEPIRFGDYEARVHHTPGHCPGGVCLQIGEEGQRAPPVRRGHAVCRLDRAHGSARRRLRRADALDYAGAVSARRRRGRASGPRAGHDDRPRADNKSVCPRVPEGALKPVRQCRFGTTATSLLQEERRNGGPFDRPPKAACRNVREHKYKPLWNVGGLYLRSLTSRLSARDAPTNRTALSPCVSVAPFLL